MQQHVLTKTSNLGNEIIKVLVGADDAAETFTVHEKLICERSEFFHKTLDGDWKEAQDRVVELPKDDPKIFQLYISSLYVSQHTKTSCSPHIMRRHGETVAGLVRGNLC
jgi:hypothetical protein